MVIVGSIIVDFILTDSTITDLVLIDLIIIASIVIDLIIIDSLISYPKSVLCIGSPWSRKLDSNICGFHSNDLCNICLTDSRHGSREHSPIGFMKFGVLKFVE